MSDCRYAFWRRIDRPGHDVARLASAGEEWILEGHAAFDENGPTGIRYRVSLDPDYLTIAATIEGHHRGEAFAHEFRRDDRGWHFDGRGVAGLDDLVHLDFGFTPATNLQQLCHAGLEVGEERDVPAAWFDIGEPTLVRMPQSYRRVTDFHYDYSSPTAGYEATLELAPNGFVRLYPELWEMEPLRG